MALARPAVLRGSMSSWDEQALAQVAGRDADRVEALDFREDGLDLGLGNHQAVVEHHVVEDRLDGPPEVAVLVNRADDLLGNERLRLVEVEQPDLVVEAVGE